MANEGIDSSERLSLYQLRARQLEKKEFLTSDDHGVNKRWQWLRDLEAQRQRLADEMLELMDFDNEQFFEVIKRAKAEPEKLIERCAECSKSAKWMLKNEAYATRALKEHTDACLLHIALLEVSIPDLIGQLSSAFERYQSAPENLKKMVLSSITVEQSVPFVTDVMSKAYLHLGAVKILKKREDYLRDRRHGKAVSERKITKKESEQIIKIMLKMLQQCSPPRNPALSTVQMVDYYTESVLEVWETWPFISLSDIDVKQVIGDVIKELELSPKKSKALFRRRIRTPMTRIPQPEKMPDVIASSEAKYHQAKARQHGMAEALVQVLEGKFEELSSEEKAAIFDASPLQLGVWLRCVHDATSISQALEVVG